MTKDARPLESVIERYLESACTSRGWLCFKTMSPSTNGFPDRTIVTNDGTVVFCEVKRPGEKPRKLQRKAALLPLLAHHANVVVVDTTVAVDVLVRHLEHGVPFQLTDDTSFYIELD